MPVSAVHPAATVGSLGFLRVRLQCQNRVLHRGVSDLGLSGRLPAVLWVRAGHSRGLRRADHQGAEPSAPAAVAVCRAPAAEPVCKPAAPVLTVFHAGKANRSLPAASAVPPPAAATTADAPVSSSAAVAGRQSVCSLSVLYSSGSVMRVYLKYLRQRAAPLNQ